MIRLSSGQLSSPSLASQMAFAATAGDECRNVLPLRARRRILAPSSANLAATNHLPAQDYVSMAPTPGSIALRSNESCRY
jgi:hypothetical protein